MVWVSREEISVGEYVDSFGSIRVRKLTLYKKKVEKQDEKGLVMCLIEVGRD